MVSDEPELVQEHTPAIVARGSRTAVEAIQIVGHGPTLAKP